MMASKCVLSNCISSNVLKETASKDFLVPPESIYGSCSRTV
jgi:hypothetical protein